MWPGLFETIGHITKLEVQFKFIDGEGLCAILVDGNKPQENALGAYLVTRNRPDTSGIRETDPKLILFNILRTCIFHLERKFAEVAKTVPDEPMGRIRRSPYIETQQEIEEFVQWCKNSEYKIVRDRISDKDSIPWFFPSINGFLSAIPEDDWYLTPGDTLNESTHPFTNQHTGTNLSLLEVIERIGEPHITTKHLNARKLAMSWRISMTQFGARPRRPRSLSTAKGSSGGEWGEENKWQGEKAKENLPDAEEFAGLVNADEDTLPSQTLHITNDNDFPMDYAPSELDGDLEPKMPVFPTQYDKLPYIELPGDLRDYLA
ncbi:hypothetical protein C8J57DRAFT_1238187 [Mycena rebaudengoi]|nr:hypothetical protein C8J57DRAFT_1238187 [Mycena rebaudengoi]